MRATKNVDAMVVLLHAKKLLWLNGLLLSHLSRVWKTSVGQNSIEPVLSQILHASAQERHAVSDCESRVLDRIPVI